MIIIIYIPQRKFIVSYFECNYTYNIHLVRKTLFNIVHVLFPSLFPCLFDYMQCLAVSPRLSGVSDEVALGLTNGRVIVTAFEQAAVPAAERRARVTKEYNTD